MDEASKSMTFATGVSLSGDKDCEAIQASIELDVQGGLSYLDGISVGVSVDGDDFSSQLEDLSGGQFGANNIGCDATGCRSYFTFLGDSQSLEEALQQGQELPVGRVIILDDDDDELCRGEVILLGR